jgi:hypothetical protein
MSAGQRKMYENFFDKTDAMGEKDGNVSISELKKMIVQEMGQDKTDQEIAVSDWVADLGRRAPLCAKIKAFSRS